MGNPKGSFGTDNLEEFWPEPEFKGYYSHLLDLMEQFEICYQLKDSRKYLVPRMMEKMPLKDFTVSEESKLKFYYEYKFMPEGLLNRLSVRLHDRNWRPQ